MEIRIERKGKKQGTIGWLAKGLEDGSITIAEGITGTGKHGLWLKYPDAAGVKHSQILAVRNPHNLTPGDYYDCYAYEVALRNGSDGWSQGDLIDCTDACWLTIRRIASDWIGQVEEDRDEEDSITVTIKRVEIV